MGGRGKFGVTADLLKTARKLQNTVLGNKEVFTKGIEDLRKLVNTLKKQSEKANMGQKVKNLHISAFANDYPILEKFVARFNKTYKNLCNPNK